MAEVTQWARDIYEKYSPSFSILEIQHILDYFIELCGKQDIDPQLIDLDEEIDWALTYYECRDQVKELVGGIDEEAMTELWITNQLEAATSVLEGTEHEIVESKTLERLERAARRLEKIQAREKALKRQLEELQRKEAEREAEERRKREEERRRLEELEEARKPPPPPEPRFVTVQDVVDYSVDAALTHIAEDYIRVNARRIYQSQGRGPARDFLKERIRNWGFTGPGLPFIKGTPTGIEIDYADEVYTTTYNELLNRALDPGYRLAYRHVPEVEILPPEVAAKFKPGDKVRYKGTVTSLEGVRGPPWTYTLGRDVGRVSGIPDNELELVVVGVPPEKPLVEAPPLIEVGLQKADEEMLRDFFLTKLMEGTLSHSAARGHLPEFRLLLGKVREAWKDVPRERAVSESRSDVEALVESIVIRRPPVRVRRPPVRPPEEVPPVFPVPVLVPIAPPPGLMRRWGMPFALHACPACMGEDKPLEECMQYSSPYLNSRLRRMGVPTSDPLFFKLCDEHRRKYGGAYELFPRYKTEFWVGETVAKGEMDISVMVGMGVSEEYVLYSIAFYDEAKHLAIQ